MKKLPLLFLIVLFAVSCSKTTDQEFLDQGQKFVKENKIKEAISSFESLLKEYPDSKLAPKALVHLASIYQSLLVKEISQKDSYEKAQKYFREVFDKYPASEEAPNSLFMASFILANNLERYDEATQSYKLFIEKYPNDPLVTSAHSELENMGMTPEDILKKNEVAGN